MDFNVNTSVNSGPTPTKKKAGKYFGFYLTVILFVVSFGLGFLSGQYYFVQKNVTDENGEVEQVKVLKLNRMINRSDEVDFQQFWDVWDKIKSKYVKTDVKDVDLFYGAMQGLVYALGDPYSLYFPPKAADEFAKDLSGELEGIGAEIGVKNQQLTIIAPLANTPAEKAGLRPGDKVMEINKEQTIGMDANTAVSKIRGKAGTEVALVIERDGSTEPQEIKIIRAKINVPSVTFSMKNDEVGYFRIMQFNEDTQKQFDKGIKDFQSRGGKKIILDLRSNPGGYLDQAIKMSSEWIEKGIVVSEKGNDGNSKNHEALGNARLSDIKTIVLINGGSASASEIVAGALRDTKKATLVGTKTFGKGSVQDYEMFEDGSALKITVAEWFTPNGLNINKEGIAPDVEVKEDWEKEKVGEDSVLDKAMELLK